MNKNLSLDFIGTLHIQECLQGYILPLVQALAELDFPRGQNGLNDPKGKWKIIAALW